VSIYLDTSALAKLVVNEQESAALRSWIGTRSGTPLCTCVIGAVELQRMSARAGQLALATAVRLLARIDLLELTAPVLALAGQLPPPEVRTLDALHVASAALFSDLVVVITYDNQMAAAARGYGLPVASPG